MARRPVAEQPDRGASVRGRRPTVGLLVSDIGESRAEQVWRSAANTALQHGANPVCYSVGSIHSPDLAAADGKAPLSCLVGTEAVDGLVTFAWSRSREWFTEVCTRSGPMPVVNVMRLYQGYPGVSWNND